MSIPNVSRKVAYEVARRIVAPTLLVIAAACSSSVAPRSGVTLLVTNETCATGTCDSLRILAFPSVQVNTPAGSWAIDLGLVSTPQACLTIPATARFLVVGVNDDGSRDTTTIGWSNAQAMRLGALPPRTTPSDTHATSGEFIPAAAAGWSIDVPAGTSAVSAAACHS